jgi:hypothetical protein
MRSVLIAAVAGLIASRPVLADAPNYPVKVLSVVPRSPDLKPFVMSVPADGRHKQPTGESAGSKPSDAAAARVLAITGQGQNPSGAGQSPEFASTTPEHR